jgi:hypothetical protein
MGDDGLHVDEAGTWARRLGRVAQPASRMLLRGAKAPRNLFKSTRAAAQGLRDFSPGANAISAIRPPFKATQEFLVTGYLSV